jgi:hypothetical protein
MSTIEKIQTFAILSEEIFAIFNHRQIKHLFPQINNDLIQ